MESLQEGTIIQQNSMFGASSPNVCFGISSAAENNFEVIRIVRKPTSPLWKSYTLFPDIEQKKEIVSFRTFGFGLLALSLLVVSVVFHFFPSDSKIQS